MATEEDPFADVVGSDGGNVVPFEAPSYPEERGGAPLTVAPTIRATPFTWRDPALIPRRQFLYGFELRRGQISAVVAPGAAGKTTLKVGRAICMATGRDLMGHRVWNGPHRVWLWNLEDEREEVEKTVHAFLKHWDIHPDELGGRLFIDGADSPAAGKLKLAVEDARRGTVIQRPVSEALIEHLIEQRIDYLDVDPFISSHSVDENSNQAIDAVAKEWVRIAQEANCAVSLAHHVRKTSAAETTSSDARGAGAMVNAARSVLVFQKMTKDAAQEMRVAECDRKRFFSVYDDKNNKAPAAANAEWYEFVGVGLGNGDDSGPEDNIGALQRWTPPDVMGGVTPYQLSQVQKLVNEQPMKARKHSMSAKWVGKIVAHVLDRNLDDPSEVTAIKRMVGIWIANGALRTVEKLDEKREPREFVEVGTWAILD